MFNLSGKHVVITGGGSGIGKDIALIFAKQGAHVVILDIDENGSLDTVHSIENNGGSALFKKCNIAEESQVRQVIDEIAICCNYKIDILVNNAGISHIGNAESTTQADFEKLISVNIKGIYNVVQISLPYMKAKGGVILNMGSVASLVGLSERFAYSMTKGAVSGMSLSIAKDYLSYNIRCNTISPARVHTPFVDGFLAKSYAGKEEEMFKKLSNSQPIGRMANSIEIAHLALYLCSDEASFITGCDYPIDGGFTRLNN